VIQLTEQELRELLRRVARAVGEEEYEDGFLDAQAEYVLQTFLKEKHDV
jgi:hypothetical protein